MKDKSFLYLGWVLLIAALIMAGFVGYKIRANQEVIPKSTKVITKETVDERGLISVVFMECGQE
jgi:hypothetical protein